MSDRVLSSGKARESIQRFRQILDGGLTAQIEALDKEGQTLSEKEVWDGRLATQFRGDWQETHAALMKVREQLKELQSQLQQIHQNIMQAGGNQ